jgi:hypothetical protein
MYWFGDERDLNGQGLEITEGAPKEERNALFFAKPLFRFEEIETTAVGLPAGPPCGHGARLRLKS